MGANDKAMDLQPTTGETPLASPPAYGNDQQSRMEFYAGRDFAQMFGRNPTASELASLAPSYAGDKNIDNTSAGKAAVAQYFQAMSNTPVNQQAAQNAKYAAQAPQYYDKINGMFQGTLGRDATDAEKNHFGSLMATGAVDDYTVGQFLSALPESVQKQDAAFRTSLTSDLQKQDAQYYNEQIMPGITAANARAGRSTESSGYQNALALAAQQQNRQRESFLSNLTAQQYGNSQGLAQDSYNNAYSGYQNLQNYSMQRSNQMQDQATGRVRELQDYTTQKNAYDDYLRRYGKRNGSSAYGGALAGGVSGAASGAMLGSVVPGIGTAVGAGVGFLAGAAGGYFGGR